VDDWQDNPLFLQAQSLVTSLLETQTEGSDQARLCRQRQEHGLAVARTLAQWQASPELVAAGLLHTFLWKKLATPEQIAQLCGWDVAALCRDHQRILQEEPLNRRPGTPNVHRRIRFYVAAYRDPRLALLGVADIWDHFRSAREGAGPERRTFAQEARECYVPLLEMLGMRALQDELADWAFEQAERKAYQKLQRLLAADRPLHQQAFEQVLAALPPALPEAEPPVWEKHRPARVYDGRYSELAHPEVFQTVSIKLVVPEEKRCYTALQAIHRIWRPLEGRVADTVSICKLNGYRALETTVETFVENARRLLLHFTIVTPEMDAINQQGLAAVLGRGPSAPELANAWWNRREEANRHIHSAEPGAQPETLYVFSPQGELFSLPQGCTVVDYAYRVHSHLANQCRTFWLNGVPVEPMTRLHHLDLVWVEQDPRAPGPTQAWLNAARTSRARQLVRRFLRRQGHSFQTGRHILERRRQKMEQHYGFRLLNEDVERTLREATRKLKLGRVESLLEKIADGHLSVDKLLHPLFAREIARQILLPEELRLGVHQVQLAQCCRPRPGDDILGRVRRRGGRAVGISVHRVDCKDHLKANRVETVPLEWRLIPLQRSVDRLVMQARDSSGILGQVLEHIYARQPKMTLHEVRAVARHGRARLELTVEAEGENLLEDLVADLEVLPGHQVDEVRRMGLLPSEVEALALPINTPTNPYNRLPVEDPDLFYGRKEELGRIHRWLLDNQGMICIRGQQRVGKTSLLLQVKRQYSQTGLDEHLYPVYPGLYLPIVVDFQTFGHMESNQLFYAVAEAVFNELQHRGRIGSVGAPPRTLFQISPAQQLISYLRDIHAQAGLRLLLLLDEFSTTIDAYHQQVLDGHFFSQWKGLVTATRDFASYVAVIQEQTYSQLSQSAAASVPAEPAWQALQLGPSLVLSPLHQQDARDLIQRPVRNYFEYAPEALERVLQLTGGSPFLIQGFCYSLVNHMAHTQRRRVELADVKEVERSFLRPGENLCTHLVGRVHGLAMPICTELARLTYPDGRPVAQERLLEALPDMDPELVMRTLHEMAEKHILIPSEEKHWRFASLLFAGWLARIPH